MFSTSHPIAVASTLAAWWLIRIDRNTANDNNHANTYSNANANANHNRHRNTQAFTREKSEAAP